MGNGNYCTNCGSGAFKMPTYNGSYYGGNKRVNKVSFGLLALLTGSFGVHRFYSGKVKSGIAYILFCWTMIPSVLSLVEGIMALTKEDDGTGMIDVDPDKFFI